MQPMTCKNCLAPINPHLDHCEYCGGYFERPRYFVGTSLNDFNLKAQTEKLYADALKAMREYDNGPIYSAAEKVKFMTPNEMRATMGLDPFTDEQIIPLERNCEMMFDKCNGRFIVKKPLHATYNELGGNGAIEKSKKKLFGFRR